MRFCCILAGMYRWGWSERCILHGVVWDVPLRVVVVHFCCVLAGMHRWEYAERCILHEVMQYAPVAMMPADRAYVDNRYHSTTYPFSALLAGELIRMFSP